MVVGFIGSGNMATAMARGWAASADGPEVMLFTDSGSGRAATLAGEVGGEAVESNREVFERADLAVIAVKPGGLESVAADAHGSTPRLSILSILAATPVSRIAESFPGRDALRVMPNLPVEVGRGVLCLSVADGVDPNRVERISALLGRLGRVVRLDESAFDTATAVMSCSPAYMAMAIGAIADAGADDGMDPELALAMTAESAAGTAELLARRTPEQIAEAVASPGGSTEAGLVALEEHGLEAALEAAVRASLDRMRGQ